MPDGIVAVGFVFRWMSAELRNLPGLDAIQLSQNPPAGASLRPCHCSLDSQLLQAVRDPMLRGLELPPDLFDRGSSTFR
jgi:hypothetical protein